MSETKEFHIGDVISITDGHLVALDHMGAIYKICEWMTGEQGLMTHQLPRVAAEIKPYLVGQFPELAKVKVPDTVNSRETADAFLSTLYNSYGEYVQVMPIPTDAHTVIEPITELFMKRPDAKVIAVQVDE